MDKEELVKFWKPSASGSVSRNCKTEYFYTIWLISLEKLIEWNLYENFIADVVKEVPMRFWKSSGYGRRSRLDLPWSARLLLNCRIFKVKKKAGAFFELELLKCLEQFCLFSSLLRALANCLENRSTHKKTNED